MRVMVALEDRFFKSPDGNVYSNTITDYNFWKRYLQVFDEVVVLARVCKSKQQDSVGVQSNGPNVRFIEVPYFVGPFGFLRNYFQVQKVVSGAVDEADAFVLRIPGTLGSLLYSNLIKAKKPYGVEVVGDPWDSLAPGSVKSILRPFIRKKAYKNMVLQCRNASVASYVTESSLQKRYPPGCWSTHYSSISLPEEALINESLLKERSHRIVKKSEAIDKQAWRICHVGMMEHLYKAPDVLIDAVANCIKRGLNIELVLIGDGCFRQQLQQQTANRGISDKVRFLGKINPGIPVLQELDNSDIYVLPSRQEGLPRTIIEAMARGLPCIASNVGGIPELLEAEDMVGPDEVDRLADKIATVLEDPERMRKMSSRNYHKAKNFSIKILNPRRMKYYQKLIENTLKANFQ